MLSSMIVEDPHNSCVLVVSVCLEQSIQPDYVKEAVSPGYDGKCAGRGECGNPFARLCTGDSCTCLLLTVGTRFAFVGDDPVV